ncbi:diguanylate cyclase (GGDEF) domain-containing protein [Modicisalibacter xianhensis]|uniref:diguanylate cyclase n=1 Tax=Modicisalibacter xianhensis TaxID=442341 RepID=A0A1I3GHS5_9GAMM|nr:diguanylate cyclase (GGDEF) domain-containing protein [Halomonas xianhensis]
MPNSVRWLESTLRRISVGKRMAIAALTLVVPMTALITVSVSVLQHQERELHHTIDEAVNLLVPLATLEYDLQRALTDALSAETGEPVPDYGGLTLSIDRLFSELSSAAPEPDMDADMIAQAQQAWRLARPTIEGIVEQARPLQLSGERPSYGVVRQQLTTAIQDLEQVRMHLASAVKRQAAEASQTQQRQLHLLILAWVATLIAAFLLFSLIVYSIVRPARDLGRAIERLGSGDLSVRVDGGARDELGAVARYLDTMTQRFAIWKSVLEDAAHQDALTRLPNRRAILATLEAALTVAQEQQGVVSVMMIDVDRFKQINDRFGHAAGDRALVWLADTLRGLLRSEDILGRYAGDEFLAVLPGTPHDEALRIAERLCRGASHASRDDPAKPSVTIGVASTGSGAQNAEALLEAADRALFQGKRAGRGQVVPG